MTPESASFLPQPTTGRAHSPIVVRERIYSRRCVSASLSMMRARTRLRMYVYLSSAGDRASLHSLFLSECGSSTAALMEISLRMWLNER